MTMTTDVQTPEADVPVWRDVAAASEAAQSEPRKPVRRLVKAKLAETAVADLGRQQAQEQIDREAILAERKAFNAELRSRLEAVDMRLKGLSEAIRSGVGVEEREVFEREIDGKIELVDADGMVLEAADVPAEKRQLTLAEARTSDDDVHEDTDELGYDPNDDEDEDSDPPPPDSFDAAKFADASTDIVDPDAVLAGATDEKPAKKSRKKKG